MKKIHYTELPGSEPGNQLATEWDTYRREAGRLLSEGNEGKWVLIKDSEIIGLYQTRAEADTEAFHRYGMVGALIHQINEWETPVRLPTRFYLWPHLYFPSARMG